MATYSVAQQAASIPASGSAIWEIRTAAADRAVIAQVGFSGTFPTSASILALGRPTAIGVTPTSPITWLADDPGDPVGTVQVATAWGTGPTAPTAFFRRVRMFSNMTAYWYFPKGITIPISSSIVLWVVTLGTSAAVELFTAGDE